MRGVTRRIVNAISQTIFQSTLPMRGVTNEKLQSTSDKTISIHTPHAGSDLVAAFKNLWETNISIHTPHAGSDAPGDILWLGYDNDFNQHSPCGE